MKRIFNSDTGATIWKGEDYLVDGQPAPVVPPLHILTDVRREAPDHDPLTERVSRVAAHADIEAGEFVTESFEIVPLTSSELAALARKTWHNAAAFLGEFSLEELAAISLSLDPTVAALRLLLASWAADVWSDDPRIQLGLAKLVETGIIDEIRKTAILLKP